jgi:hypothetical protein
MLKFAALVFVPAILTAQPQPRAMPSDCAVDGFVFNAVTKEPVVRAHVIAPQSEAWAVTDATGHWSLSNIRCGRFQAAATRTGYLIGRVQNAVTLTSGAPSHDVRLELTPQAVVTGTVTDEAGDPVLGAQISVMRSRVMQGRRSFFAVSGVQTNDLGEYRVPGLEAGKYIFCARVTNDIATPPGGSFANAEMCYPGPPEGGVSSAMDVAAGRETRVDFTLRPVPAVHIRGTAIGMPKNQGAAITLQQRGFFRGGANTRPANLTPDGKFDLAGVTPGSYVLVTDYWENGGRLTARVPVEVGSADVEGVVLQLQPGLSVSGTVRFESNSGRPMPSQNWTPILRAVDPNAGGGQVKWSKDRLSFTIADIVAGSYRIEGGPPPPFYIKRAVLAGHDLTHEDVPILQSGGELEIVLADDSGSIEGTVEDASGDPPFNAVAVVMQEGRLPRLQPVGPEGRFTIPNLAPGDYRVYAWDDFSEVEWADPEWMKQQGSRGQTVTVQPSQKSQVKLVEQKIAH